MPAETHKTYALLIGVDSYQPSEIYKDLRGCVRDVNLVDAYLQQSLQLPPEQIHRLTAPIEETVLFNVRSTSDPKPTYQNIIQAFAELTSIAQTGDRIHLHYSGHGGRAVTCYPELKEQQDSDEGLVPCDYAQTGRYLRDVEIATLLKRMTDKGLVVTFVLDSCHSGGATRGDSAIRGASKIDQKLDLRESLVGSHKELIENWRSLSKGSLPGSKILPPGLLPAKDYVLLAACRPTEYAFEYAINGGERHGALTFWTIDTLKSLGPQISYQTLHNRVSAKVQGDHPSQLPMLLGDGGRTVFNGDRQQIQNTATVLQIDLEKHTVAINAGNAQGVSTGSRFAIYPLNANITEETQPQAIVEVHQTEATQSTARIVPLAEGGVPLGDAGIEQGAPAKMLSASVELVRRVKLYDRKQVGDRTHELPAALVDQQVEAIAAVRQAMSGNGWLLEVEAGDFSIKDTARIEGMSDRESHYQVSVGRDGTYEICADGPIQNLSPPLATGQPNAAEQVVKRLVHLSKYQTVFALSNPSSEIRHTLECQLLDPNQQPLSTSRRIAIQKDKQFFLQIRNKGKSPLNIAVLNLEPNWAISQIAISGLTTPFYQLDKGASELLSLRFSLPESERYVQSQETIKIFAAESPVDFRYLLLPPLDEEIERKRGASNKQPDNAFSRLLAAVGSGSSTAPALTRAVVSVADPQAQWATEQFSLVVEP